VTADIYYHPAPECEAYARHCRVCRKPWCPICLPQCDCGPRTLDWRHAVCGDEVWCQLSAETLTCVEYLDAMDTADAAIGR
jgi:hypothetical protein